MLVERSYREIRPPGDFFNGSTFETLLTENRERRCLQPLPFLRASLLTWLRQEPFAGQQVWTLAHASFRLSINTPTSAPAQHQSIQPPNTPATSAAMLGNTTGKNALENGSSNSVGSAIETAPAIHCSRAGWNRRQSRRTIQAMTGKLTANSRS